MALKQSTVGTIVLVMLFLFALPFAAGGLAIDVGVLWSGCNFLRMRSWQEVPCKILATTLEEQQGDDSVSYRVTARYQYEIAGQQYFGQRVTLDDSSVGSSFSKRTHAELEKHRDSGQPFRCYVNPNAPGESILNRDLRWEVAALQAVAAIAFSGVGFGLLAVVVAGWRKVRTNPAFDSSRPWLVRDDWARGEIRHSDGPMGSILLCVGLFAIVISIPSALASGWELLTSNDYLAALGLLPAGFGYLLLHFGRRARARWRRYGDSLLQMASVPGVIGGSLAGVIRIERRVESPEGFVMRLRCLETTQTHSANNETSSSTRVVCEQERTILHEMPSAGFEGMAIPVLFGIPYGSPDSDDRSRDFQISWTLDVRSLSPEADYKADFAVPVFRTPESSPNFQLDESLIADYEAPVDSQAPIRQAGLRVEPLENGGALFVFPAGRNIGLAFFVLILQSIFVAVVVGLCYYKWPVAWPYVATFFGVGMLYSIVDLFGYSSEVEATRAGLAVRGGIYNLGGRQDIAASEIEKVFAAGAGVSGNPTGLDLFATLHGGKRVRLAKRVWPSSAADTVVQRIEAILRGTPPPG